MSGRIKKALRIIFTVIVTAAIVYFVIKKVSFSEVLDTLKKADFRIIALAMGISIVSNTLIVSYRWMLVLKRLGHPVPLTETLFIKIGSRVLPFKSDEVSRVLYLKRLNGIPYERAIFSVISEYVLSALTLFFYIAVGLILFWSRTMSLKTLGGAGVAGFIGFFVLGMIRKKSASRKSDKAGYMPLLKEHIREFRGLALGKEIITVNLLYWLFDFINIYLISSAVGSPLPPEAIILFMPMAIFAGGLPVTTGCFGTREVALMCLFASYASADILFTVSIIYYFVEQLFPNFFCAAFCGMFLNKLIWKNNHNAHPVSDD